MGTARAKPRKRMLRLNQFPKSVYSFLCFSFFILVFEPVLLCLFLLHASVNFVTFSIRYFRFSFTQFLFPDRISTLMLYVLVETFSFFYFVYNSNHNAQRTFAQQLLGLVPLNSKKWKVCP